jgi:hypothetical protein
MVGVNRPKRFELKNTPLTLANFKRNWNPFKPPMVQNSVELAAYLDIQIGLALGASLLYSTSRNIFFDAKMVWSNPVFGVLNFMHTAWQFWGLWVAFIKVDYARKGALYTSEGKVYPMLSLLLFKHRWLLRVVFFLILPAVFYWLLNELN